LCVRTKRNGWGGGSARTDGEVGRRKVAAKRRRGYGLLLVAAMARTSNFGRE